MYSRVKIAVLLSQQQRSTPLKLRLIPYVYCPLKYTETITSTICVGVEPKQKGRTCPADIMETPSLTPPYLFAGVSCVGS